jgi:hypothetical protein
VPPLTHALARPSLAPICFATLLCALARPSGAEPALLDQPGAHPDYLLEIEPHLLFAFDPPGPAQGGLGGGIRASLELIDPGFISKLNNTVALGLGADWVGASRADSALWLPVVLQWNFWVARRWSLFGEPGAGIWLLEAEGVRPTFGAGGRYHAADLFAFTLRIAYPALTAGLSFAI